MPKTRDWHHRPRAAVQRAPEGLARSRRARWKHGLYLAEALAEQKRACALLIQSREFLKQFTAAEPLKNAKGDCRIRP